MRKKAFILTLMMILAVSCSAQSRSFNSGSSGWQHPLESGLRKHEKLHKDKMKEFKQTSPGRKFRDDVAGDKHRAFFDQETEVQSRQDRYRGDQNYNNSGVRKPTDPFTLR